MIMASLARAEVVKRKKKKPDTKKRLRFSDYNKGKYDRARIEIPIGQDEGKKGEESKEEEESDRGVLIINPDGKSKKMDGNTVYSN
jgi:hypothetical protein